MQAALWRVGRPLDTQWRLLRLLGVGGSSAVYEVIGDRGERAAVKLLSQHDLPLATLVVLAAREAALTRAVDHPGVVDMSREVLTEDGSVYLPMELLVGETLEQRRRLAGGSLPAADALTIFDALLDVVAATHDRDIVHHDLKPSNVFLTWSGQVKLLDFGLARRGCADPLPSAWFGTPGFVAPELVRGELGRIDGRADVWSLGAAMFLVLSGQHVHPAPTCAEEVALAGTMPARSLQEASPDLPPGVVELVDRALAFDPDDRWADVRAMRAALADHVPATAPTPREAESGVHLAKCRAAHAGPESPWALAVTDTLPDLPGNERTGTAW
jgi:serine/threonine-protein kinase